MPPRPTGAAESGRPGPGRIVLPALDGDRRIQVFGVLFALGCLAHEAQFFLELQRVVPPLEYMERWAQVKPTSGLSSAVGLAIHLTTAVVSLAVILLPWRRALLALLALPVLLLGLVSPERISAHYSLMAAGLLLINLFVVAQLLEGRTARAGAKTTDWYYWTVIGLRSLAVLTYFFAFLHKLNRGWFSQEDGDAARMLLAAIGPLVDLIGMPTQQALSLLSGPAVYAPLILEASLVVLLLHPRTRLLACLVGVLFHLPMLMVRVIDFPVLLMAFFPLFVGREEAVALLERCRARPSTPRLLGTVVTAAFLVVASLRAAPLMRLREGTDGWLQLLNDLLGSTILVLFIWIGSGLGAALIDRRTRPAPAGLTPSVEATLRRGIAG